MHISMKSFFSQSIKYSSTEIEKLDVHRQWLNRITYPIFFFKFMVVEDISIRYQNHTRIFPNRYRFVLGSVGDAVYGCTFGIIC